MRRLVIVIGLSLLCPVTAAAQLQSQVVVTGLSSPVAFIQDPTLTDTHYVVQQGGRIRTVVNGVVQSADFLDIRGFSFGTGGERGLLGMAFAPDYSTSGRFFIFFTNGSGNIVVSRFRRMSGDPRRGDISTRFDLLWPEGNRFITHPFSNHNAGDLKFGPDGYLYIPMGDGGSGSDPGHRAQTPSTLLGKMLRINVNVSDADVEGYDVPPGNPFIGQAGYLPEIWSFGWRNPWRFSFDSFGPGATGAIIVGDVGQGSWEEVDYEPANTGGRNYGWRNREGAHDHVTSLPPAYTPLRDPIHEYGRSVGTTVVGGFVYRGSALPISYRGRYFFADYGSSRVFMLTLSLDGAGDATVTAVDDVTTELGGTSALGNISSFGIDSAGEIYLVSHSRGEVRRIVAANRPSQIAMSLDAPAAGALVQPFSMGGWAIDLGQANSTTGVDTVHMWAFPLPSGTPIFLGAAYGWARPDVAATYGSNYQNSGFGLVVNGLPAGTYRLSAHPYSTVTNQFESFASVQVTIVSGPVMSMDFPGNGATVAAAFPISGWAIDREFPTGTGVDTVHVWAYPAAGGSPRFVGAADYGSSRPDVGAVFGGRFTNSGWTLTGRGLPAGTWTIVASMHSLATGTYRLSSSATVQVQNGGIVHIDSPPPSTVTQTFQILGWAVDLAAQSGTGISAIHVWAFPVSGGSPTFVGAAPAGDNRGTLGVSRTDVGAVYGAQFNPSGYQVTVGMPAGTYDVVVYALSSLSGVAVAGRVVRLTVN